MRHGERRLTSLLLSACAKRSPTRTPIKRDPSAGTLRLRKSLSPPIETSPGTPSRNDPLVDEFFLRRMMEEKGKESEGRGRGGGGRAAEDVCWMRGEQDQIRLCELAQSRLSNDDDDAHRC